MIKRLYKCDNPACGHEFHAYQDKGDPLLTDCPACAVANASHDIDRETAIGEARLQRMLDSGVPPGKRTVRTEALKTVEKMVDDMGMTNMSDSGKAGDIAAKAPTPPHAREIQEMTHAMVEAKQMSDQEATHFAKGAETFWQGSKTATPARLQKHISAAPAASAAARREGIDPIEIFHKAGKSGHLKRKGQVVAAVRG